jgi:hypothetical protein
LAPSLLLDLIFLFLKATTKPAHYHHRPYLESASNHFPNASHVIAFGIVPIVLQIAARRKKKEGRNSSRIYVSSLTVSYSSGSIKEEFPFICSSLSFGSRKLFHSAREKKKRELDRNTRGQK